MEPSSFTCCLMLHYRAKCAGASSLSRGLCHFVKGLSPWPTSDVIQEGTLREHRINN